MKLAFTIAHISYSVNLVAWTALKAIKYKLMSISFVLEKEVQRAHTLQKRKYIHTCHERWFEFKLSKQEFSMNFP